MAKNPERNTTDGMIVTVDDVVVWDGEGEQLGLPSLVGRKSPVVRIPRPDGGHPAPAADWREALVSPNRARLVRARAVRPAASAGRSGHTNVTMPEKLRILLITLVHNQYRSGAASPEGASLLGQQRLCTPSILIMQNDD
jgi:hypothetical protein